MDSSDLKSIENLVTKFEENCTKNAIIGELGFFYKYIYLFEILIIAIIFILYYAIRFLLLGFRFNSATIEALGIHDAWSFLIYLLVLVFFMIVTFIVVIGGEYILLKKVNSKYNVNNKNTFKKITSKIKLPCVDLAIKDELLKRKKMFIDTNLAGYSRNQVFTIYQLSNDVANNMTLEISNASNLNTYVSFLTVIFTILLTSVLENNVFQIKNTSDLLILIAIDLVTIFLIYFFYRGLIYIYGIFEKRFLLSYLKKKEKQIKEFSAFLREAVINYDYYYEKEKSNIENNVLKKVILTSDEKERLHERPYFTFVKVSQSSLSKNLFYIDLIFKNDGLEKSFRTYPESNNKINISNKTVTFRRVKPNRTPVINVNQEFTTTWCFDDAKNFENCMVNVVIEFLDVLERKYTQSFEIALSMVNGEIHGDAISYSDPVLKNE